MYGTDGISVGPEVNLGLPKWQQKSSSVVSYLRLSLHKDATKETQCVPNLRRTTQYSRGKGVKFQVTVKVGTENINSELILFNSVCSKFQIPTTLTAASGDIASRTICLGRRGLANPKGRSRTGPEDNAGLTVTAPIGLQHAVHSATAGIFFQIILIHYEIVWSLDPRLLNMNCLDQ